MSVSPEKFNFVPPTMPESLEDQYAHLRVEASYGAQRFDIDPLQLFDEIGHELVTQDDITAEDIVIALQHETGRSLNTNGIKNLLGWAHEEITRHRDSEKLAIMTPTRRLKHLYGVDIIFEDPVPKEAAG